MARTGRPKSDNPKTERLYIRATKAEMDTFSYVAEAMGMSMSEAVLQTMEERADEIWKSREALSKEYDIKKLNPRKNPYNENVTNQ